MRIYNNTTLLAWLLLAVWLLVPLGTIGLFDDGVFYGVVSRNWVYAADSSNWWQLKVSDALDANFGGHPPMAFWLQSLFFRVFGEEAHWVERLYSLLMALLTLQGIRAIWKLLLPDYKRYSYLPVAFWLLMPIVGWSYSNNMLENTLSVFAIWAVFLQLLYAQKGGWYWLVLAWVGIICATLTKGPVGLFPLATLPILGLSRAKIEPKYILLSVLGAGVVAGFYAVLYYSWADAAAFLRRYVGLQLVPSLSGESMATSRFLVLRKALEENILAAIFALLAYLFLRYRYKEKQIQVADKQVFIFFILSAVSASLPIMLSPKQLPFYIVPALPLFALAWAAASLAIFVELAKKSAPQIWLSRILLTGQTVALILCAYNWGKIGRNTDMLHDVFLLRPLVSHQTIGLHQSLYNQWNLHGYMYRFGYCNLSTVHTERHFWLLPLGDTLRSAGYRKMDIGLRTYQLYQREG
jgi:4-amino-4-deoxy-L-arabinose transferase-like glycosyltransferase